VLPQWAKAHPLRQDALDPGLARLREGLDRGTCGFGSDFRGSNLPVFVTSSHHRIRFCCLDQFRAAWNGVSTFLGAQGLDRENRGREKLSGGGRGRASKRASRLWGKKRAAAERAYANAPGFFIAGGSATLLLHSAGREGPFKGGRNECADRGRMLLAGGGGVAPLPSARDMQKPSGIIERLFAGEGSGC